MGSRPEMSEEPYVRDIARTMARSKYPLEWFEGYPSELFGEIKQLRREYRDEISHEGIATGHERMAARQRATAVAHTK